MLQGGAGRIVVELARAQQAAGHQVAVACTANEADGYSHYPAWREQLLHADIPVLPVRCTFRRALHHLMGAVDGLERTAFVRAGVDVVHAHAAVPALVGQLLHRRVPVVATMHGWNHAKAAEHAATDVAIFNRLPFVAVPSRAAAGHLTTAGVDAARVLVVPYGVAPQASAGLSDEDGALLERWRARGAVVLVCIGSVGTRKRQRLVIDALAAPALRHRVACAFLGEGPDLEAHREAARDLGLDDTVAFLGYRANVTDWLLASDGALFPSQREGLPIALLETAALGGCVIASDIDEHREVITSGESGLLFDAGSVNCLQVTLEQAVRLSAAHRRSMGETARLVWSEAHQPERMHAAYARLYGRATAGRAPQTLDALAS